MPRVDGQSLLVGRRDLADSGLAIGEKIAAGHPEIGGILGRKLVDGGGGVVMTTGGPERAGDAGDARPGVIAGLLGGLEALAGLVVCGQRRVGQGLVEQGEGAPVGGAQRLDGLGHAAEQLLADAQADGGGRAAFGVGFQLAHGVTQVAVGRGLRPERLEHSPDLGGAERARARHQIANIGSDSGSHTCSTSYVTV